MIKPVKQYTLEGTICNKDSHNAPSISRLYHCYCERIFVSSLVNTRQPSSGICVAFSEVMRCFQYKNFSPAAPK